MPDIHAGTAAFEPRLMEAAIEKTNAFSPDLVVGDLATKGYREELEEAKTYLDLLGCPNLSVVPGNHDAHNVGHYHFEDLFGVREKDLTLPIPEGERRRGTYFPLCFAARASVRQRSFWNKIALTAV